MNCGIWSWRSAGDPGGTGQDDRSAGEQGKAAGERGRRRAARHIVHWLWERAGRRQARACGRNQQVASAGPGQLAAAAKPGPKLAALNS